MSENPASAKLLTFGKADLRDLSELCAILHECLLASEGGNGENALLTMARMKIAIVRRRYGISETLVVPSEPK